MKLLLVNPWGVNNDQYYASGFISGMNKKIDLDYACNYYYQGIEPNQKMYRLFFRKSEIMNFSKIRTIVRGLEYIYAWTQILKIVKKNTYDIVHFHWLLMYSVDNIFLKKLKKSYKGKIILTAHNVIPHINGEKKIRKLKRIYEKFDIILVHGENIKREFENYFPEYINKVKVQYHGTYHQYQEKIQFESLQEEVINTYEEKKQFYDKKLLMFGAHYYNKGTDRLLEIWKKKFHSERVLLEIVGKKDGTYPELDEAKKSLTAEDNIFYIDKYLNDDTLNYIIKDCDAVLIPYRHATMSGVIFTSAIFSKAVLCTQCGALAEYLINGKDGFICKNTEQGIYEGLKKIINLSPEELKMIGIQLNRNISEKYSWEKITDMICEKIYT